MERGCIQGLPNFFPVAPIISGTGRATNFKFCTRIHRIARNKSPFKISGKVAVGVLSNSQKFSGHPYIRCIARSSLRQLGFLVSQTVTRDIRHSNGRPSWRQSLQPLWNARL